MASSPKNSLSREEIIRERALLMRGILKQSLFVWIQGGKLKEGGGEPKVNQQKQTVMRTEAQVRSQK